MKHLRLLILILMVMLFTKQSYAHGLNKVGDKATLFSQHGSLLIKVDITPNSVNYNTANSLYISIIDQEAGHFYQGPVNASLLRSDEASQNTGVASMQFNRGLFKEKILLSEGGPYQLNLNFQDNTDFSPVQINFQLDDNRLFARSVLISILSGIFISIFIITSAVYLKKKSPTITNRGRRLTCDI
jgi:hypothetical protein